MCIEDCSSYCLRGFQGSQWWVHDTEGTNLHTGMFQANKHTILGFGKAHVTEITLITSKLVCHQTFQHRFPLKYWYLAAWALAERNYHIPQLWCRQRGQGQEVGKVVGVVAGGRYVGDAKGDFLEAGCIGQEMIHQRSRYGRGGNGELLLW